MAEIDRKAELIAELAQSRARAVVNVRALRHDLDFASRARRAFKMHPAVWLGGAIVIGLFISRLPLSRKRTAMPRRKAEATVEKVEKAGLLLGALKIAFDIARPTLMGLATRFVADYFQAGNREGPRRR